MTRIPDAISVAGPDTHCLVVAVPYDGQVDVSSNLPRPVAAAILRQLADGLEAQPCATSLATGELCPVHDRPADREQQTDADPGQSCENCGHAAHGHAEHLTNPEALTDCPHCPCAAELREMNGHGPAAVTSTPAERAVVETRQNLAFNADQQSPALAAMRDALLDPRQATPATALATAFVLLAAHTRELAALIRNRRDAIEAQHGLNRSTRGLLTGYEGARKMLDSLADSLDEQADR